MTRKGITDTTIKNKGTNNMKTLSKESIKQQTIDTINAYEKAIAIMPKDTKGYQAAVDYLETLKAKLVKKGKVNPQQHLLRQTLGQHKTTKETLMNDLSNKGTTKSFDELNGILDKQVNGNLGEMHTAWEAERNVGVEFNTFSEFLIGYYFTYPIDHRSVFDNATS